MSRIYPDPFAKRPRPYLSGLGASRKQPRAFRRAPAAYLTRFGAARLRKTKQKGPHPLGQVHNINIAKKAAPSDPFQERWWQFKDLPRSQY